MCVMGAREEVARDLSEEGSQLLNTPKLCFEFWLGEKVIHMSVRRVFWGIS